MTANQMAEFYVFSTIIGILLVWCLVIWLSRRPLPPPEDLYIDPYRERSILSTTTPVQVTVTPVQRTNDGFAEGMMMGAMMQSPAIGQAVINETIVNETFVTDSVNETVCDPEPAQVSYDDCTYHDVNASGGGDN